MNGTRNDHTGAAPALLPQIVPVLETIESLYAELDAMGDRQRTLVDAEDPAPLLALLGERQRVVDELRAADDRFRPLGARLERERAGLSPEERERVDACLEGIAAIAARVRDRDEETQGQLAQRRDSIAAELSGLSKSRTARAAYGGPGVPTPRFQDREV